MSQKWKNIKFVTFIVHGERAKTYPGECKKSNTRYRSPHRCDAYIECYDGEPTEKICHYGQYFYNITDIRKYPCEYLDESICGNRYYPRQVVDLKHLTGHFL